MNKRKLPMVEFDMVKEALVAGGIVLALVVGCAAILGAPYSPAITIRQIARQHPHELVETAMRDLTGQSQIAQYGPPYTNIPANAQHLGFLSPERWFGVTHPVNPPQVDVITPLTEAAVIDPALSAPLATWQQASKTQEAAWATAFDAAVPTAQISATSDLELSASATAASGPLPAMMSGLLRLGRAGLLGAAINGPRDVYSYSEQNSLLFLQGQVMAQIAAKRDLLGTQWGILHEEGPYPGPWWLTPYSFLYQIPPYRTSPNGDLMAAGTMAVVFVLLMFVPFLPGVNQLPKRLRVYRLIWRDYYRWVRGEPHGPAPAKREVTAVHATRHST